MEFYCAFVFLLAFPNVLCTRIFGERPKYEDTWQYQQRDPYDNEYMQNYFPRLPSNEFRADIREAPFMAIIFADNSFREYPFMTGVIISNRWILTTAKTLEIQKGKNLKVLTGIHNMSIRNDDRHFNRVIRQVLHSNYVAEEVYNDIALIKVEREIIFNDRQRYIPLMSPTELNDFQHQSQYDARVNLTLYHYGSKHQAYFQVLKKSVISVNIGVVDFSDRLFVCAQRTIPTCYGDTGSPAIVNGSLVGLLAIEYGCGVHFPNVFIGIAHYYDWIRNALMF